MKAIFTRGPIQGVRLGVALTLACLLMVFDHQGHRVQAIRQSLITAVSPVFYLAEVPTDVYGSVSGSFASRADLERELKRLQDEQFLYRTQLQRLVALESENARLRALLGSARKARGKRMVAEIVQVDLEASEKHVLINKGLSDGLYEGQAVLDAFGVLGQIIEVSHTTSRVLLLTDARHGTPVRVERTGFNAVAEGTGALNRLRLKFVPNTTDIRTGDLLVSSGLGERFPDGYPVGEVVEVNKDPAEPYAAIDVITAARMDSSGEVLVLWPSLADSSAIREKGAQP